MSVAKGPCGTRRRSASGQQARIVMDIPRTHPRIIVGSILQENPFNLPPDWFFEELRARDALGA